MSGIILDVLLWILSIVLVLGFVLGLIAKSNHKDYVKRGNRTGIW